MAPGGVTASVAGGAVTSEPSSMSMMISTLASWFPEVGGSVTGPVGAASAPRATSVEELGIDPVALRGERERERDVMVPIIDWPT